MHLNYSILIITLFLFAYAGYEETMKLISYLDLQVRYALIKIQMKWMAWNLKRGLVKDLANFDKFIEEYKNEHKNLQ